MITDFKSYSAFKCPFFWIFTKGKNCILRYCKLLFYDKFVQIFAIKKFILYFKMGRTSYSYKKASEMLLLFLWRHAAKEMKISWMALIWISHISKLGCLYGCIYSRKWAKKVTIENSSIFRIGFYYFIFK